MINEASKVVFDDEFDDDIAPQGTPVDTPDNDDYNQSDVIDTEPGNNTDDSSNQVNVDDNQGDSEDIITQYLKSKGIVDPSAIKQVDDNGNVQEVDFNKLSKEEQLGILGSSDLDNNYGLENDEVQLINTLRDNSLSVKDYIDYVRKNAVDEYVNANSGPQYTVDSMSDDELYLLDLKDKLKDITDEEANSYLEHEKSDESFWNKKISALREDYKAKEDSQIEQQQLIQQQEAEQQQQEFSNAMTDAIGNLNSIESFDLEDADKDKIAEFVLGQDATGTNYMYRALQDPESVAKMAWFLLEGENSIKALNNYWKNEVKERSKNNYEAGYNDAKSGKTSKTVVRTAPKTSSTTKNSNKVIGLNSTQNILDLD